MVIICLFTGGSVFVKVYVAEVFPRIPRRLCDSLTSYTVLLSAFPTRHLNPNNICLWYHRPALRFSQVKMSLGTNVSSFKMALYPSKFHSIKKWTIKYKYSLYMRIAFSHNLRYIWVRVSFQSMCLQDHHFQHSPVDMPFGDWLRV